MGYEWIPAAVSAAASGTAGILQATKRRGSTRMMNVAKELAQYNNDIAVQNWQRENAYNTPAAQMQRYQDAGLNPNLVYSQQNTAGGISGGAVDTNPEHYQGESKASAALQGMANAIGTYQQLRSQQIANSNANLVGDLTREQIIEKQQSNEFQRMVRGYQIEDMALKVQNQRFQTYEKNQRELESLLEDIKQKKANTEKIISDTDLNESRKENLERQTRHYDAMEAAIRSTIKVNDARISDMSNQAMFRSGQLALGWANHSLGLDRHKFDVRQWDEQSDMRGYQQDMAKYNSENMPYLLLNKNLESWAGSGVQAMPNVLLKSLWHMIHGTQPARKFGIY